MANPPVLSAVLVCVQVRRDHRGEPKGPLQAATVEQPAEQLQGAEGPGGRTPQQPQGEPDAVQQTSETRQHHQPGECNLVVICCGVNPVKPRLATRCCGYYSWLTHIIDICLNRV